jgi:RNA polymerase sigma factor (sigma-70 family)
MSAVDASLTCGATALEQSEVDTDHRAPVEQQSSSESISSHKSFLEETTPTRSEWERALQYPLPLPNCVEEWDFDHMECPFYSTTICPLVDKPRVQSAAPDHSVEPPVPEDEIPDQLLDGRAIRRELSDLAQQAVETEIAMHGAPTHYTVLARMVRRRYPSIPLSDSSAHTHLSASARCRQVDRGLFEPLRRLRKNDYVRREIDARYRLRLEQLSKARLAKSFLPGNRLLEDLSTRPRLSGEKAADKWVTLAVWRRLDRLLPVPPKGTVRPAKRILRWLSDAKEMKSRGRQILDRSPLISQEGARERASTSESAPRLVCDAVMRLLEESGDTTEFDEGVQCVCLLLQFPEAQAIFGDPRHLSWHQIEKTGQSLSAARVKGLLEDIRAHADRVRNELAEANLRLVVWLARKYSRARLLDLDDLIQEGAFGLLTAIDRFNPFLGFTFATYATHWIRQTVERALADQDRVIRHPVHFGETLRKIQRADELTDAEEEDPHITRLRQLVQSHSQPRALDDAIPLGNLHTAVSDLYLESIPSAVTLGIARERMAPDDEVGRFALRDDVQEVLSSLPPRQRDVLSLRFGLEDGCDRTLEEVGQEFGVTRERIRQIEEKALEKMRHPSRTKKLRDYLT